MKKLNQLIGLLNDELGLFLSICLGLYLFVLFFQPFPLDRFDFNNRLIFVSGLGGIVFLFMFLVRIVLPWILRKDSKNESDTALLYHKGGFIILILSSVAFPFYLRFVGSVSISFYLMFKVVLICLVPPIILGVFDSIKELKRQNESLIKEKRTIQELLGKYEDDYLNKSIDFFSENSSEKLSFPIAEVAFIKSADNYVEIVYKESDNLKKKLIRNTLKNIEQQIRPYSNFIRCHRICIVNLHYIEKLDSDSSSHWLTIRGYNEPIPVSRQYLLKLKEAL